MSSFGMSSGSTPVKKNSRLEAFHAPLLNTSGGSASLSFEESAGFPISSPHHGEAHVPQGQSSMLSLSYTYLTSILGAGIVGLPYVLRQSGLIGGVVLMAVVAFLSDYTLRLLVRTAQRVRVGNYEDLCRWAFGWKGYGIVSLCMFLFDYGALLTYIIILGDVGTPILTYFVDVGDEEMARRVLICGISCVLIFPWLLGRDISKLEKSSAIAVVSVFFVVIIVVYEFGDSFPITKDKVQNFNSGIMSSFGTAAFAFVTHDSTFLLYNSLFNATTERWATLTHIALGSALFISLLFSVSGYLTFTDETQSNILKNYDSSSPLILVLEVLYTFTMALTYPISFFVARHVVYAGFHMKKDPAKYISVKDASQLWHLGITIPLFLSSLGICLFVRDLGVVMALTGSLAAVNLAYVLPCACALKLNDFHWWPWYNEEPDRWFAFVETFPVLACMIFGLFAGILSTTQTILTEFGIDLPF